MISAIIPVHNSGPRLDGCREGLRTWGYSGYGCIVAHSDTLARVVDTFARPPRPMPSFDRNVLDPIWQVFGAYPVAASARIPSSTHGAGTPG